MKSLKISKDVSLPPDVVTQTIAILAKRRGGKSYTMRKICEELLDANQQLVMVDPKGDQWGIRSSADGKKAGYPIIILGGEHGDLPLEVSAGEVVAKLVVEERASVLLDLSLFRKSEVSTFMAIFLENLYRLKAKEQYRTPLMLVVDEADAIAPQKPQANEARMLGAIEDIVRRGGQRGIGCALITQRSAVLNKNVLTQAQMLIVLRTIAPQDLAAMKAWIEVHGTLEEAKEMMESLPSLPIGDAWFWSPGWPTEAGIFQRTHVLPIKTFDSGATPKPGARKVVPKTSADVDMKALEKQMAATIEKAKAEDPQMLKKRIFELEKELKKGSIPSPVPKSNTEQEIFKAVKKATQERDAEWQAKLRVANKELERLQKILVNVQKLTREETWMIVEEPPKLYGFPVHVTDSPSDVELMSRAEPGSVIKIPRKLDNALDMMVAEGRSKLGKGELKILTAIAQHGMEGITREHLTVVTNYTRSSRNTYLQRLSAAGLIRQEGDRFYDTPEGTHLLGNYEPMPIAGPELVQHVLSTLPAGEGRILRLLIEEGPLDREGISEKTGYTKSSRNTYIQRLRTRELITVEGNFIRPSDKLL